MASLPASNNARLSDSTRLIRLQMLRLSTEDQKKNGFVMEPLTKEQIEGKRRCQVCNKSKRS
jgi:hypothetical protein